MLPGPKGPRLINDEGSTVKNRPADFRVPEKLETPKAGSKKTEKQITARIRALPVFGESPHGASAALNRIEVHRQERLVDKRVPFGNENGQFLLKLRTLGVGQLEMHPKSDDSSSLIRGLTLVVGGVVWS